MTYTIETELKNYILDCINDGILTNENKDEWHYHAFNEDCYIIYHSRAIEWLKKHSINKRLLDQLVERTGNPNYKINGFISSMNGVLADFKSTIPMKGKINSLNVSATA